MISPSQLIPSFPPSIIQCYQIILATAKYAFSCLGYRFKKQPFGDQLIVIHFAGYGRITLIIGYCKGIEPLNVIFQGTIKAFLLLCTQTREDIFYLVKLIV